jgi:hypothetical protein
MSSLYGQKSELDTRITDSDPITGEYFDTTHHPLVVEPCPVTTMINQFRRKRGDS